MAASTIHTLLIKLGFDTSSLSPGVNLIRSELERLNSSASKTASSFVPATTALENFAAASQAVAGSLKSPQALNNMAESVRTLSTTLRGSHAAISQTVSAYALLQRELATTTHSGANIELIATTIKNVAVAANGATPAVRQWIAAMREANANIGATDPARLERMLMETSRQMEQNANAASRYNAYLTQMAKAQILAAETARIQAQQQQAANAAYAAFMRQQMLAQVVANSAAYSQQQVARSAMDAYNNTRMIPGTSISVAEGMRRAATEAKALAAATGEAANRASFFQRTLSMAFAFSGGVAVTNVISFLSNALVGFNSRLEQAHIAFTNLIGSASGADAFIAKMEQFANLTPFDFQGLDDDVQKLMAMGFAANEALPVLRAIGDAVAGLGGSQEKLDRIAIALGQIKTAGRVNSQDMRQLTEAGIPAWDLLATSIGKTTAETRKLAEAGLLPANAALKAIVGGMETRFGGMMEKQARTAQGAWTTIHDVVIQAVAGAIQPAFEAVSKIMLFVADFLQSGGGQYIAPTIWAIGVALAVGLIPQLYAAATAAGAFSIAIGSLSVPILPLIIAVNVLGLAWQQNWLGIQGVVTPVITTLVSLFGQLGAAMSFLKPLIEPLAIIVATRLAVSFAVAGASALWNAAANRTLAGTYTQLTLDTVAQTGASMRLGVVQTAVGAATAASAAGATRAGAALVGLRAGAAGLYAALGGIVAVFAAWAIVIVLVITQTDEILRGIVGLNAALSLLNVKILEILSSAPLIGGAFNGALDGAKKQAADLIAQYDVLDAKIKAKEAAGDPTASTSDFWRGMDDEMANFMHSLDNGSSDVATGTQKLVDVFGMTLQGVVEAGKSAGTDAMAEMAKAIEDSRSAPVEAVSHLIDLMADQMDTGARVARVYGLLNSSYLANGLASGDPAVVAAAQALQDSLKDQWKQLTGVAYQAGFDANKAFATGYADAKAYMDKYAWYLPEAARDSSAKAQAQALVDNYKKLIPPQTAVNDQMKKFNEELAKSRASSNSFASDLSSAFREIQSAAEEEFRVQHQHNLDLISDELAKKNAMLDTKAALNQGPVDAAQRALDARRKQIEEWRLREAVRTATDPAGQRDAILALQDFLAQSHVDRMQREVDLANKKIKEQQDMNTRLAEDQKAAEDRRYDLMQRDFERQLELLHQYLLKHPGEWQNTEDKIIALLKSYGFDYRQAGLDLGSAYVAGIREKIAAAQKAAQDLAKASQPPDLGGGTGKTPIVNPYTGFTTGWQYMGTPQVNAQTGFTTYPSYDTGSWNILHDNLLAYLHLGETVVPASVAPLIRELGKNKHDTIPMGAFGAVGAMSGSSGPIGQPPKTIQIYIGDEKVGEVVDRGLYDQYTAYGPGGGTAVLHAGGSAR